MLNQIEELLYIRGVFLEMADRLEESQTIREADLMMYIQYAAKDFFEAVGDFPPVVFFTCSPGRRETEQPGFKSTQADPRLSSNPKWTFLWKIEAHAPSGGWQIFYLDGLEEVKGKPAKKIILEKPDDRRRLMHIMRRWYRDLGVMIERLEREAETEKKGRETPDTPVMVDAKQRTTDKEPECSVSLGDGVYQVGATKVNVDYKENDVLGVF